MLNVPKLPPYKGKDPAAAALWAASNAESSLAARLYAAGIVNWNTSKAARTVCNVLLEEYRDAQLDAGNAAAEDDHLIFSLALDGYADAGVLSLINWKEVAAGVALMPFYPPAGIAVGLSSFNYYKNLQGTIQKALSVNGTLTDALKRLALVDQDAAALIAVEAGENVKGVSSDLYTARMVEIAKIPVKIYEAAKNAAGALADGIGDALFWVGVAAAAGIGFGLYHRAKGR